jgi:hypothetical protein
MSLGEDRVVHHNKIRYQLTALGQTLPSHSTPMRINVSCCPKSDQIADKPRVTKRAKNGSEQD